MLKGSDVMPPRVRTSEEDIVNAAIEIVREKGSEAVNARSVAERLGCSVQPIFRVFSSMDEVRAAVYKGAEEIYNRAMMTAMHESGEGFLAMGIAYVLFAKTEKNLFRLLFMSGAFNQGSAADIAGSTQGDDEVIALISSMTGIAKAKAQELFTAIWFTVHGMASLLATNSCTLSDEETRRILKMTFEGLCHSLKTEENLIK